MKLSKMKIETGPQIRLARQALGLNATQFGGMVDMTQTNVYRIEAGSRPAPARFTRLLNAYLNGYRPADWPVDEREIAV